MNFKKTIAKSLVVAMALGMVPVANLQTAKAAALSKIEIGADGIAKAKGDAKFWGIAKVDPKGGKGSVKIGTKYYKISNIQEYAGEVDAYSALKGKAGVIAAGEKAVFDDTWKVAEVAAAESTFKVQIVASTSAVKGLPGKAANALGGDYGWLVGTIGKGTVKEVNWVSSEAAIEVKQNDGSWQTIKKFFADTETIDSAKVTAKLRALGQNGTTLTFRIMGTTNVWASKEAKVKVTGQAKAPSVKIDINKDTTTIKKGIEWQVVETTKDPDAAKWNVSTDKKGLSLADLKLPGTDKAYDVLVRTGASGKKLASKVGRVTLNKPAAALKIGVDDGGKKAIKATGGAIQENNDVLATVETSLAYDITKGATLKNTSKKDIEYALVTDGKLDKFKWSTLKAAKDEKKPSKATLKYSKDYKANTWSNDGKTTLFVRLAGVKQDKNNVATLSGVSAGAIMKLANIKQDFKFVTVNANDVVVENATATKASIKVATGTAASFKLDATINNLTNAKGGTPKIKPITALPKGVTIKVGKINDITGKFDVTINVSNKAFTSEAIAAEAEYSLKYEGVDTTFKVKFEKKS